MVVREDGISRIGLNSIGVLYDAHEHHIRSMDLPSAFAGAGQCEAQYYCQLREKYPGVKSADLAFGEYDYTVGDYSVVIPDKGSFLNHWANRGESVYLDYLDVKE